MQKLASKNGVKQEECAMSIDFLHQQPRVLFYACPAGTSLQDQSENGRSFWSLLLVGSSTGFERGMYVTCACVSPASNILSVRD